MLIETVDVEMAFDIILLKALRDLTSACAVFQVETISPTDARRF